MAWTDPRTWVTNELVTAALMNAHVRDNLDFLYAHHGCRLYKSASQTVVAGNTDLITWNSESYDTDAFHSTAVNTGRVTAPWDGYYRAILEVNVDADGSHHNGSYQIQMRLNAAGSDVGGTQLESARTAGHSNAQAGTLHWQGVLSAADYIEGFFLSATEARDVTGGSTGSNFEIEFLGG